MSQEREHFELDGIADSCPGCSHKLSEHTVEVGCIVETDDNVCTCILDQWDIELFYIIHAGREHLFNKGHCGTEDIIIPSDR